MDGTYAAFDYMDKNRGGEGGNIVNITSIAGKVMNKARNQNVV